MTQNIYDNPEFFEGYMELRDSRSGLNEVLEHPAMKERLPLVLGKSVLDLGCGTGDLCLYLAGKGALDVTGVDASENMIAVARKRIGGNVKLIQSSIEDFKAQSEEFDLVVSSLVFHYIQDLNILFQNVSRWLRPGGVLLFSVEHPITTSSQGIRNGWVLDKEGKRAAWQVDAYSEEGRRVSHWFVDGVVKYHRKISTILNTITHAGLLINAVDEPHSPEEIEERDPRLKEERKRPPFLIVRAVKPMSD